MGLKSLSPETSDAQTVTIMIDVGMSMETSGFSYLGARVLKLEFFSIPDYKKNQEATYAPDLC